MKTLAEIKNLVGDTVITEVYSDSLEYPYFFLGDECLGWAEYVDLSNFDIFELLGFKQETYRLEDESEDEDEDEGETEELSSFVQSNSSSLKGLLEALADKRPAVVVVKTRAVS
jgi:hypothetical protein